MVEKKKGITILGSAGGVAKALLSILNKSVINNQDPLFHLISDNHVHFHLIDINQKEKGYYNHLFPNLKKNLVIHQFDLKDINQFLKHLKLTNTKIVVDISWADTIEMLNCCNKLGVYYVNTALENTMVDENEKLYEGFPLMARIDQFEEKKDLFQNTKAIVCSGMNPGVVQWMALELMKKSPSEAPLGCYIVEQDNSFYKDKSVAKKDVLYTTWSPECFLDEAILSFPMLMKHKTPLFLYEDVYALDFKVTLGEKQFNGCLMPHEEVYSLCSMYDMEGGFIYKVNDHTTNLIRSNLNNVDDLWDFEMKVLDPAEAPLEGEDLVGVLLVYKDKERYMYNKLSNQEVYDIYQTNATYFQVACGIYAAFSTLFLDEIPNGVYTVEELLLNTDNQYGRYLTHYMTDFEFGENNHTDGLLLDRMTRIYE